MVRAADIYDKKSLKAWLDARPGDDDARRKVVVQIAYRAAMRVLPLGWEWVAYANSARERDLTSLVILRLNLIGGVAGKFPTPPIRAAAAAARSATPRAAAVRSASPRAASACAASATASAAATARAASDARAASASAAYAASAAHAAAGLIWTTCRSDAEAIEAGRDLTAAPLWADENPFAKAWKQIEQQESRPDSPYDFWRRWYQTHLDPATYPPMPPEMLRDIALIDPKIWESTPEDLAKEIARIEAEYEDPPGRAREDDEGTALAQAKYFDFIEVDKQLRMIGVRADFEDLTEDQIEHFLKDMRDWAQELQDWRDYAQDEVSGNQPSMLLRIVDKLLGHIAKDHSFDDFSARRFITLGSDLRRVSFDENQRLLVGDTLAAMLDDRVDQYSKIAAGCFGSAVQALAPLHDLDLDQNDPEVLIEKMRDGLALIRQADPEELAQLDPEGRAVIDEMIRELEELDAAISAAENPKAAQLLRKRFAERYGGISATVGRLVEKGREVASRAASNFDEAVKWYKRWDTLEKIVDWWNSLGPPPPGL